MLRHGRVFGTWNSMDKVRKGGKGGIYLMLGGVIRVTWLS